MPAKRGLAQRFDSKNHVDIIHQPRPEERAPKSGLPDFGNQKVSKSATADFDARVSKDGHTRDRARGHPSRWPREERGLLRMRSEGLISIVRCDWSHRIDPLESPSRMS